MFKEQLVVFRLVYAYRVSTILTRNYSLYVQGNLQRGSLVVLCAPVASSVGSQPSLLWHVGKAYTLSQEWKNVQLAKLGKYTLHSLYGFTDLTRTQLQRFMVMRNDFVFWASELRLSWIWCSKSFIIIIKTIIKQCISVVIYKLAKVLVLGGHVRLAGEKHDWCWRKIHMKFIKHRRSNWSNL